MLLPALNQARDKAKSSSCLSNLKQLGLSMEMYAGDFDMYVPIETQFGMTVSNTVFSPIFLLINHQYTSRETAICCSVRGMTNRYDYSPTNIATAHWLWWYVDYGYNTSGIGDDICARLGNGAAQSGPYGGAIPLRPGRARNSSTKIVFGDAMRYTSTLSRTYGVYWCLDYKLTETGFGEGCLADRHSMNSANAVFLDGHGENLKNPLSLHCAGTSLDNHFESNAHKYFCRGNRQQ
jgi:prepilin-type processing-associated H-X9-DG protein